MLLSGIQGFAFRVQITASARFCVFRHCQRLFPLFGGGGGGWMIHVCNRGEGGVSGPGDRGGSRF